MASICLYDIDFWHGQNFSPPNLELMKVFNYYYKKGDLIKFGKPKENFDRYNQTIFFKSNPNTKIPKALNLAGEDKQIYGFGFFKEFSPLADKFSKIEPNYLPYDLEEDKIKNIKLYNHIKKNSLIRVENKDFSDFKKDCNTIYIADYDFLNLSNADDFIKQFKRDYNIKFLYPLITNNVEQFEKFFSIAIISNRRLVVNFKFTKDFFKKYYYENIFFSAEPFECETNPSIYLQRILKMLLWAKNEQKSISFTSKTFNKIELKEKPLLSLSDYIYKWGYIKSDISCYDYLISVMDRDFLENLIANKRNLRLLLKQSPRTFDIKNVDFFEKI